MHHTKYQDILVCFALTSVSDRIFNGTGFHKECFVYKVKEIFKKNPEIMDFVSKCSADFISNLENDFCERQLAGSGAENTVKG